MSRRMASYWTQTDKIPNSMGKKQLSHPFGEGIDGKHGGLFFERTPNSIRRSKKKNRHSVTKLNLIVRWWRIYCENSSLHGFRYLSEQRPLWERVIWFFIILAMIISATVVILEQLKQYLQSPTLISFDTMQTPISSIPFPAITICPQSQLKRETFNLEWALANLDNLTEEQENQFDFLLSWCKLLYYTSKRPLHSSDLVTRQAETINSFENCKVSFPFLSWGGSSVIMACSVAQPLVTEFGACIAFNMMPLDQIIRHSNVTLVADSWTTKYQGREQIWSPDSGYIHKMDDVQIEDRTPPWSPSNDGLFNNLVLLLKTPPKGYDEVCSTGKGFLGIIHNPAELPGGTHSIFYVDEGRMMNLQMSPKLYTIDQRLKSWTPTERGCYLQSERTLRHFNVYTQRNCELECAVNYTERECGCAFFYHPRFPEMKVCGGSKQVNCAANSIGSVSSLKCDCKPSCSDLEYEIVTSYVIRKNWSEKFVNLELESEPSFFSYVAVKFHQHYVQGIRRSALFSPTDFLANAGGLFGLFLGFSILSLIEFTYFVTVRLWIVFKDSKNLGSRAVK